MFRRNASTCFNLHPITITWMQPSERIIHAARMIVDRLDLAADDPQRDRHAERLGEQARVARKLVIEELHERGVTPDHNLLLTAGLREDLMHLETTQLLWRFTMWRGRRGTDSWSWWRRRSGACVKEIQS